MSRFGEHDVNIEKGLSELLLSLQTKLELTREEAIGLVRMAFEEKLRDALSRTDVQVEAFKARKPVVELTTYPPIGSPGKPGDPEPKKADKDAYDKALEKEDKKEESKTFFKRK